MARTIAALAGLVLSACGGTTADPAGCPIPAHGAGYLVLVSGNVGQQDLVASALDGSCQETLVGVAGRALAPAWHAASGRIAFTALRGGAQRIGIFDLANRRETLLATGTLQTYGPVISPDGSAMVFEGWEGSGRSDIYVVPIAGGTPVAVGPSSTSQDGGPTWSPDGTAIYFTSSRSGAWEIWKMDRDGANPVQVTMGGQPAGRPAISADGGTLAYARTSGGQQRVVLHALATGDERLLSDNPDDDPAFDATGTKLAVRTQRFGVGFQVIVVDAEAGLLLQQTTSGSAVSGAPSFPR